MSLAAMAAMAVPALLPMHADAQVSGSWKVTGGGNWSNVANWSGSGYPDAAGVATLGTAITAAATVNLDTNVSLSALQITTNSTTINYTVTGTNTMTLTGAGT